METIQQQFNEQALDNALRDLLGRAPKTPDQEEVGTSWLLHEQVNKILMCAAQCHHLEWVAWSLRHNLDQHDVRYVFYNMINTDRTDISSVAKVFLPYIDVHDRNCYAFAQSCFYQHHETASLLLSHIDHSQHHSQIALGLNYYIKMGGTGALVEQILNLNDPQVPIDVNIIERAAQSGHAEMLQRVMQRSMEQGIGAHECQLWAAFGAVLGEHYDIFEQAACQLDDYHQSMCEVLGLGSHETYLGFHAKMQNKTLTQEVHDNNAPRRRAAKI